MACQAPQPNVTPLWHQSARRRRPTSRRPCPSHSTAGADPEGRSADACGVSSLGGNGDGKIRISPTKMHDSLGIHGIK